MFVLYWCNLSAHTLSKSNDLTPLTRWKDFHTLYFKPEPVITTAMFGLVNKAKMFICSKCQRVSIPDVLWYTLVITILLLKGGKLVLAVVCFVFNSKVIRTCWCWFWQKNLWNYCDSDPCPKKEKWKENILFIPWYICKVKSGDQKIAPYFLQRCKSSLCFFYSMPHPHLGRETVHWYS